MDFEGIILSLELLGAFLSRIDLQCLAVSKVESSPDDAPSPHHLLEYVDRAQFAKDRYLIK